MNKLIENDKYLIFKAIKGQGESFGALFDKYSNKIYRYIYYKVSRKEVAEDLASQCFLKAWEHISQKQTIIKNFQSFIYKIARNLIIDYYRSREKEELPLIYQMEQNSEILSFAPDVNLDKEELEKILFKLKPDIREIIVLRYIEGFSIKEIAKIVDKSTGNIRVIIHRTLNELQQFFK